MKIQRQHSMSMMFTCVVAVLYFFLSNILSLFTISYQFLVFLLSFKGFYNFFVLSLAFLFSSCFGLLFCCMYVTFTLFCVCVFVFYWVAIFCDFLLFCLFIYFYLFGFFQNIVLDLVTLKVEDLLNISCWRYCYYVLFIVYSVKDDPGLVFLFNF